jgi:hypothetical protein
MSEQASGFDIANMTDHSHGDHRKSHEGAHDHAKHPGKDEHEENPDLPVRVDPEPEPKGNSQK